MTRHNIGFMLVDALVKDWGLEWSKDKRLQGWVAKGQVDGITVVLLKPSTYMNVSGQAVRKVLDFYKWGPEALQVIVDDVAIPFGEFRLRPKGGTGGHNGLKSIQAHIGTQDYLRLRMGVGDRKSGSLSGHVLGRFSQKEQETLDDFLRKGSQVIQRLLKGESVDDLQGEFNRRITPKQKAPGEANSQASATRGDEAPGSSGPRSGRSADKPEFNER